MINHAPTVDANKFNKKAVLTTHTVDIYRHVILRCRKTLISGITSKTLLISEIKDFDADKNTNQFQEPPFLGSETAVSCR